MLAHALEPDDTTGLDTRMILEYGSFMDSRDTFTYELRRKRGELVTRLEELRRERDRVMIDITDVVERLNHIMALIRAEEHREPGDKLPIPGEPHWRELSVPDAVMTLLKEYGGGPLHVDVIRNMLEEKGRKVGKDNVVTALVRAQRKGKVTRTAPNTFRLTSLDGEVVTQE